MRESRRKTTKKPWPHQRLAIIVGVVMVQLMGVALLLQFDSAPTPLTSPPRPTSSSPPNSPATDNKDKVSEKGGGVAPISLSPPVQPNKQQEDVVPPPPPPQQTRPPETSPTTLAPTGKNPMCSHIISNNAEADKPLFIIPKMRHMVWKSKTLDVGSAKETMSNWQTNETSFGHIIHDDAECLLLAIKFSQLRTEEASSEKMPADLRFLHPSLQRIARRQYHFNFSQVFVDFQLNIMRADACRILVVYFNGGLYTDLDVALVKRVHKWNVDWLTHDIVMVMENPFRASNYLLAATPRHPVMRVVLEYILREGQDQLPFKRSTHAVHHTTGPAVLTAAITECRLHPSYLDFPRNLHTSREETLKEEPFCSVSPPSNSSYDFVTDEDGQTWLKVRPTMDREALDHVAFHATGSTLWKGNYDSWVVRRDTQFKKLQDGDRVDALGSRATWTSTRVEQNADQAFPTLFPKLRHVVAQSSSMFAKARASRQAWKAAEPHYITRIHSTDECRLLATRFKMKGSSSQQAEIPSVICGLLAIYYFGGIYMDISVCPRTPFTDWAPKIPWDTVDMIHVSAASSDASSPSISPLFFASTIRNHCIGQVLDVYTLDMKTTAEVLQQMSYGFSTCSKLVDSIAKEWDVHYISGYKKEECLRSWVESEGGGRSIQDNYRLLSSNATGNVTPKVLLNEVELRGLISFANGEMGCV